MRMSFFRNHNRLLDGSGLSGAGAKAPLMPSYVESSSDKCSNIYLKQTRAPII